MEHGFIVLRLLFPSDHYGAISVDAAEGLLYDPSPGFKSLLPNINPFFTSSSDMRNKAMSPQPTLNPFSDVGSIQGNILPPIPLWFRPSNRDAFDCADQQSNIVPVRGGNNNPKRDSFRISQNASLRPLFAPICRVFACFFSPAIGALAKLVSNESHLQLIPMESSYFWSPFFQNALKTPALRHC